MPYAIDYDPATGNNTLRSSDVPIQEPYTVRLLAADYAHLDVTRDHPAEWSEREVPATYAEDGTILTPAFTERIQIAPERTELIRAGVCFEYERRRDETIANRPPIPPAPEPVPESVSNQQLRLALIDAGILPPAILAQLQAIPDAIAREKALAAWEYANDFKRSHPLVETLAAQLGLSAAQVDQLFREADKLG